MNRLHDRVVFKDHPHSLVFLSPIEKDDTVRNYAWMNDYDVVRFLMRRFPITLQEQESWATPAQLSNTSPTNLRVAIIEKEHGKHIGNMGIHDINWVDRSAITGTVIGDKRYWGRGFGSHAKLLLLKYAFDELGLHSVVSKVIAFNARSAAYNRKCGYREVGRIPEHIRRDGKLHDEIVMEVRPALFAPVWKNFNKGRFDKKK